MNISRLFIVRPVATSLLMIGVLLAGAVAYKQLPVSALPQVDYPTIQAVTFYPERVPTSCLLRSRRRWSVNSGRCPD